MITQIQTAAMLPLPVFLQGAMGRVHPVIPAPALPDRPEPNAEITNLFTADLRVVRVLITLRGAVLPHTTRPKGAVPTTATPKEATHVLPTTGVPDQVLPEIPTVQEVPALTAALPVAAAGHILPPAVPAGRPAHPIPEAQAGHTALAVQEVPEAPGGPIAQVVPAVPAGLLPLLLQEVTGGNSTDTYSRMVAGIPITGNQKGKNLL
jgi:hypothetical protein